MPVNLGFSVEVGCSNLFHPNLKMEFINSSKKTSLSFKHKISVHKEAHLKRKFANYRWF